MVFYFTTAGSAFLFKSIVRYLTNVLGIPIQNISADSWTPDSNPVHILILKEERTEADFLRRVYSPRNCNYIVLRYGEGPGVNLLNLSGLKDQFLIAFRPEVNAQLFTESELRTLLKRFFTSHGGDSLFESLNWVTYYLQNGVDELQTGKINFDGYQCFLTPGLKKWSEFKSRFEKYKFIAAFSSFAEDFINLNILVNVVDADIKHIKALNEVGVISLKKNNIAEYLENIRKIDYILTEILRNIGYGAFSV
jgi:hypothetical protein